jgi:hypothetical protein
MWGEQGYMRIERGRNAVGWEANWVDYRDPLEIFLDGGAPGVIEPGVPAEITVRIGERTDDCMSGTAMLHYRSGESGYAVSPLAPMGPGVYRAVLPAAECGDAPEFFFSAAGLRFGSVYTPRRPLSQPFTAEVGVRSQVFHDDFESDLGWTVENSPGLAGGGWERGIPVGGGDRSDPPTDFDGSGSCYLTGNTDGDSDVDEGWTRLISPTIDLSGGEQAVVEFAYWYRNDHGDNPNGDYLTIRLSDDGGASWVPADVVGPRAPIPVGWKRRTVVVGDHVSLTDAVRVAIEVADEGGGSLVEAGVDDFTVSYLSCGRERAAGLSEDGPRAIALSPNLPNPFSPETVIGFSVPEPTRVSLTVLGPSGRVVRTLLSGELRHAGPHAVTWDGRDDAGRPSASGVYFYRLQADGFSDMKKMLLLK